MMSRLTPSGSWTRTGFAARRVRARARGRGARAGPGCAPGTTPCGEREAGRSFIAEAPDRDTLAGGRTLDRNPRNLKPAAGACATDAALGKRHGEMVPRDGFAPPTRGFSVR